MRPSRILRHVSAYGARLLAGRVGGVVEPELAHGSAEVHVHEARLHHRDEVLSIDLQDLLKPGQRQKDSAYRGQGAAAYTGARATGHDGYSLPVRDFDCLSHFLGGAGDDHDFRVAGCLGAVVFEDYQVLGGVQDVPLPNHPD